VKRFRAEELVVFATARDASLTRGAEASK